MATHSSSGDAFRGGAERLRLRPGRGHRGPGLVPQRQPRGPVPGDGSAATSATRASPSRSTPPTTRPPSWPRWARTRTSSASSYQVGVLLARAQDVPVVSIAGIVQHPLNSVMALQESGITRPRDLVGRTVGYPGIATDPPLLKTMLEFDGVPPEEAQAVVDGMVNVGYDLVPALISKRVDAIVGGYWTHESISAENQGFPLTVMRMEKYGVPELLRAGAGDQRADPAIGVGAGAALRARPQARLRGGRRRPPGRRRHTAGAGPGGGPQDRPSRARSSWPPCGWGRTAPPSAGRPRRSG